MRSLHIPLSDSSLCFAVTFIQHVLIDLYDSTKGGLNIIIKIFFFRHGSDD